MPQLRQQVRKGCHQGRGVAEPKAARKQRHSKELGGRPNPTRNSARALQTSCTVLHGTSFVRVLRLPPHHQVEDVAALRDLLQCALEAHATAFGFEASAPIDCHCSRPRPHHLCRARRNKCDTARPLCSTCVSPDTSCPTPDL